MNTMELRKGIKEIEISQVLLLLFGVGISLGLGRVYQLLIGGWIGAVAGIVVFLVVFTATIVAMMGDA